LIGGFHRARHNLNKNESWPEKQKMLTDEEFASLLLVATPSTYGSPARIPPEHSTRLIALGYIADIQGRLRMTTPGRNRLAAGMLPPPTQAAFKAANFQSLRFGLLE
jgi:hypothetical protein